jgi:hypothetical protein
VASAVPALSHSRPFKSREIRAIFVCGAVRAPGFRQRYRAFVSGFA